MFLILYTINFLVNRSKKYTIILIEHKYLSIFYFISCFNFYDYDNAFVFNNISTYSYSALDIENGIAYPVECYTNLVFFI